MSGDVQSLLDLGRGLGLLSSADSLEDVAVVSMVYPNEVFFDETGANKEPVFMWCGYFANMSYWAQFSEKWRAVLDEEPALPYWHQASARARERKAPFDALSDEEIRHKEEKLAKLVGWQSPSGGQGAVAIVVRLPRVYYEEFVKGKITFGRELTNRERKELRINTLEREHTLVFSAAARAALGIMSRTQVGSHVNFIVDERRNDPYEPAALESLHVAKLVLPPDKQGLLGDLTFASAKSGKHLPLQAADMLAWHMGKRSRRPGEDDPMWHYIDRKPINEQRLGVDWLTNWVDNWNTTEPPVSPSS